MGLFDRVERGLERAVHGAFAKAFKAEVQPVEIASAMRRAMDDRAAVIGHGRTFVPNLFTIELAPTDFDRLTGYSDMLTDELVASAQEHAESQRYQPGGPIQVSFLSAEDLETGVFRVRPSTAKGAPPPTPSTATPAGRPATPAATPPPSSPLTAQPVPAEDWAWAPAGVAAAPPAPPRAPRARRAGTPAHPPRPTPLAGRRWRPLPAALGHHRPGTRQHRRRHSRRPGNLQAAHRDSRDQRWPAPGDQHPRPRLDERHVRQRRADHQPAPDRWRPRQRRPNHPDLPRGAPVIPTHE